MAKKRTSGTKRKQDSVFAQKVRLNAAGIDAGASEHWVALPEDRPEPLVRKFPTITKGLYELADWLIENSIDTVAVEATGVYCMPLLAVLEARGLDVHLVKPTSLKSFNDYQKTDLLDAQWIQKLHAFGLLRASFRPPQEILDLRGYVRHRRMLIEYASSSIEHMKKALTQMNVRVDRAVSDVTGSTGMKIIRGILAGTRDPFELAKHRDDRCALSEEAIAEALRGRWSDEHLFTLSHAVRTWDHYQSLIQECNTKIEQHLAGLNKKADKATMPKARRREHLRKNVLPFDGRSMFYEILGQDLTQIDGVSTSTIVTVMAEIGTDMSRWPTHRHLGSWLRLCPGSKISGGRRISSRNAPTTNRATTALRVAAQSLHKSQSALGAYFRRMRARLGSDKAIKATAYKILQMIYYTLKNGRPYIDPGADYYDQRNSQRTIKNLEKRAMKLGFQLVKVT